MGIDEKVRHGRSAPLAAWLIAAATATALGCGGGAAKKVVLPPGIEPGTLCAQVDFADPTRDEGPTLAPDEVETILQAALTALPGRSVAAVSDRRGVPLGVVANFDLGGADCRDGVNVDGNARYASADCQAAALALQLARTAGFFSSDRSLLSSRTVAYLADIQFPPGVDNAVAGGLYGIEQTNRGCSLDPRPPSPIGRYRARFNDDKFVPRARGLAAFPREADAFATVGGDPELFRRSVDEKTVDPALAADFLPCEAGLTALSRTGCSTGIATLPGGVPVFKDGRLAGGIGVVTTRDAFFAPELGLIADPRANPDEPLGLKKIVDPDAGEGAIDPVRGEFMARAFAGDAIGINDIPPKGLTRVPTDSFISVVPVPSPPPFDLVVFIDGLELPFVDKRPGIPDAEVNAPGNVGIVSRIVAPGDPYAVARPAPEGWLVGPADSPGGDLSSDEVRTIVRQACEQMERTRSFIRLPLESRATLVLSVADSDGELLGHFRMPDALFDAVDVCPAKARMSAYLSSPDVVPFDLSDVRAEGDDRGLALPIGTAVTSRGYGLGGQRFFPSGIVDTDPGPFRAVYNRDQTTPCTLGSQDPVAADFQQNGLIFFPGSIPIYKNGVLVGGFGSSGDGVEQDDIGADAGARGFEADDAIRIDQFTVRGVRLPYLKFNRKPEQ